MLKLFSNKQLQEADQFTIENEPIKSIDLMERAAKKLFSWISEHLLDDESQNHFSLFCGIGNNGGDGLALACMLQEQGATVKVYVVQVSDQFSEDFKINRERLKTDVEILDKSNYEFAIEVDSIVIDALFGSGLNRPVEGFAAEVIQEINKSNNYKIAIDIPSGLFVEENSSKVNQSIIRANHTLSIQLPKLAFLFPENERFVGTWDLIDIGLSEQYIQEADCNRFLIELNDVKSLLKNRSAFSHKGSFGHALILVGSKGKMGAAVLAAKACLRSGVGLLSMQVPQCGETVLQTSVPEAMVLADENAFILSELKTKAQFSALGIGPGIGTADETQRLFKLLIQQSTSPMVIDADALNILAKNKTWLTFLPKESILSPHPGEFKRLVGEWDNDFERLALQVDLAKKTANYIILKGKNTSIATPSGKVFFNSTGNPGMATGGSGDTLTGMLTSFLAQGYTSLESCLIGVYLHGLAGDLAADELGEESLIASDIIDFIPEAFHFIKA